MSRTTAGPPPPISSILAEIFLQHLEKTRILTNIDTHSQKYYIGTCMFMATYFYTKGNTRQYEHLLTHIKKSTKT